MGVTTDGNFAFERTPMKYTADKPNGYGEHIIWDRRICAGEPIFKGTRASHCAPYLLRWPRARRPKPSSSNFLR